MKHEYSLAHLTVLSLTPPQLVDVAARVGYDYVGLRMTRVTPDEVLYDLARDRALMRETKARLADTGIAVLDVELFRMDPALGAEHFLRGARCGRRARRAARHRPAARSRSRARDRTLRPAVRSRETARHLRQPRVSALDRDGNLAEAARVVRAVNRPNAGILVDMLHFGRSDSIARRARAIAARVVPLRARLRRGEGSAADAGRHHPHGARRAAVSRRGRDRRREILARLPQDIPYALEIPRVTLTRAVGPGGSRTPRSRSSRRAISTIRPASAGARRTSASALRTTATVTK